MKSKNQLVVTGFILGIFLFPLLLLFAWMNASFYFTIQIFLLLGILTVGFSGIGLYQIKKTGEQGKALAIIGLIIGGFCLFLSGVAWLDSYSICLDKCNYSSFRSGMWIYDYNYRSNDNKFFATQRQCINYCLRKY